MITLNAPRVGNVLIAPIQVRNCVSAFPLMLREEIINWMLVGLSVSKHEILNSDEKSSISISDGVFFVCELRVSMFASRRNA